MPFRGRNAPSRNVVEVFDIVHNPTPNCAIPKAPATPQQPAPAGPKTVTYSETLVRIPARPALPGAGLPAATVACGTLPAERQTMPVPCPEEPR